MTALYALLLFALGVGVGFVLIGVEESRWQARSRVPRRTADGNVHRRHAAHR